jgi:hypothetical protein
MDPFKGNRRLESGIYEGMDYALYSRHDIPDTFMPFMMLFKDGNKKLVRLAYEGDPNIGFIESLNKSEETYDQIIMCFEGRIPYENTKHDAVIVKGFDTSEAEGLLFVQRFQGIESGKGFKKLGRMSLASKTEQLPVESNPRTSNKDIEEPYISGIVLKEPDGLKSREIIAGHENGSFLANYLYQSVISSLSKNENDFSGKFNFAFVPGTLVDGAFNRFIIEQIGYEMMNDPAVKEWESENNRKLTLSYKFEGSDQVQIGQTIETNKSNRNPYTDEDSDSKPTNKENKPWWKIW